MGGKLKNVRTLLLLTATNPCKIEDFQLLCSLSMQNFNISVSRNPRNTKPMSSRRLMLLYYVDLN